MRRRIQTFFRDMVKKKPDPSDSVDPVYVPVEDSAWEEDEAKIVGSVLETKIGRFRLEKFEEGGVCQIFKGAPLPSEYEEDTPTKNIAIKRIRPKWHQHGAVQEQFKREIGIIRDFLHPQLPQFVDRGDLAGQNYYAYEYIEGVPLIRLCQDQMSYPTELVREISLSVIMQLLGQLHYLHDQMYTVVHGDISAENVVIDGSQKVYLVDFGCAYRKKKVTAQSYQWLGKPSYISPEQAQGDSWDHRSDLYQVGILYYELVAGARWNQGDEARDKILDASAKQAPRKDFLAHLTKPEISAIIAEMLEPDPNRRIQSAEECLRRLESVRAPNSP